MKKPVDSLKVLAAAIALGVLVNTGCTPTFAKEHDVADSARAIAIHDLRCTQHAWSNMDRFLVRPGLEPSACDGPAVEPTI